MECETITEEEYDRMVEEDLTIEQYGIGITAGDADLLAEIREIQAKHKAELEEELCEGLELDPTDMMCDYP